MGVINNGNSMIYLDAHLCFIFEKIFYYYKIFNLHILFDIIGRSII